MLLLLERELRADHELEVRAIVERQTQQANSEIERLIEGHRMVLETVAVAPSIRTFDPDRCPAFMALLAKQLASVTAVGIFDLDGNVRCVSDPSPRANIADRLYFRDAVTAGGFVVGRFTISRNDPTLKLLPLAAPVKDDSGRIIGVVAVGLKLSYLQTIVSGWTLPLGGSFSVSDRDGVILARNPAPETWVGTKLPDEIIRRYFKAPGPGVDDVVGPDGIHRIFGYYPVDVPPKGLYVASGISEEAALAAFDRSPSWGLGLIGIGLLGGALASIFAARFLIQRPVRDLVRLAQDRASAVPTQVSRPIAATEFEAVAAALDGMAAMIEQRSEAAAEQQRLLVRELHHRVKNILTLVQAIGVQTASSLGISGAFQDRFSERIQALARATDMLTVQDWNSLAVRDLIQSELDAMPEGDRVDLTGPKVDLPAELCLSFILIIHELATNAVKYGALASGQPDGRLTISWKIREADGREILDLKWREVCSRPLAPVSLSGFGTKLIRRVLVTIGRGSSDYGPEGLTFSMEIPLPPRRSFDSPQPLVGSTVPVQLQTAT